MMLIFQKKMRTTGGEGSLKIWTHADKGEGGKNGQKFADVLYKWPLIDGN